MRRILLYATGTIAGVVAVLLYPTSTNQSVTTDAVAVSAGTSTASTDPSTSSGAGSSTPSDPAASTGAAASADASTSTGLTDGSYSAASAMRYGTVTVTVTVSGGQVTDVQASQASNDPKSEQIAAQAIPTLNDEAVAAQSAAVAMVSHATYTSQAYADSLQQALDQAAA